MKIRPHELIMQLHDDITIAPQSMVSIEVDLNQDCVMDGRSWVVEPSATLFSTVGTKTSSKTTCRRSFSERCIHV